MLFRLFVAVVLAVATLSLLAAYLRELWVFFTKRHEYDALDKPTITGGEGGGPEVTTAAARVALAYPFMIIVCGVVTIPLCHRVISEIFR